MSTSDLGFPKSLAASAAAASSFSPGDGFSDDLVTEVLIRLPVRSLVRFEVVAKSWLSQITDPDFINKHLDHKKAKGNPRSLIVSGGNLNFESYMEGWLGPPTFASREYIYDPKVRDVVRFYCSKSGSTGEEMRDVGVPYNFLNRASATPDSRSRLIINGVINGIVCAMNEYEIPYNGKNKSIFLWNPGTFKSKELPEPTIHPEASTSQFSIGFGFESNDYKVVRMVKIGYRGIPRAEVYSAKNMSWKEIKNIEPRFLESMNHIAFDAFVDGVLYWLARDEMITLDLCKEEFDNHIRLPMLTRGTGTKLVEFRDSVALSSFSASHPTEPDRLTFWTLDDQSGKGTWSRKYSFEVLINLRGILRHFRNGDIVGELGGSAMVFYGPRKKKEVVKFPLHKEIRQVYQYTETLVSIPGFEQVKHTPGCDDIVEKKDEDKQRRTASGSGRREKCQKDS